MCHFLHIKKCSLSLCEVGKWQITCTEWVSTGYSVPKTQDHRLLLKHRNTNNNSITENKYLRWTQWFLALRNGPIWLLIWSWWLPRLGSYVLCSKKWSQVHLFQVEEWPTVACKEWVSIGYENQEHSKNNMPSFHKYWNVNKYNKNDF